MLAQNFKTPVVLGISDREFEALVKVLGMLERGELTHAKIDCDKLTFTAFRYKHSFTGHFNMGELSGEYECGTIACLLGTARLLYGKDLFSLFSQFKREDEIMKLFYPNDTGRYADITPSQAAIALRNYLTHGEPRWEEALA